MAPPLSAIRGITTAPNQGFTKRLLQSFTPNVEVIGVGLSTPQIPTGPA